MKKLIFGMVATLFMLLPLASKADGIVTTRNTCDWNFTGWRYIAKARTSKLGVFATNQDGGCQIGNYYTYRDNGCARQWARNNFGAHSEDGSVYKNKAICARGNSNSDLYFNLQEKLNKDDEQYFEASKYSTARVKFNSQSVIMDSINIKLQAKGKDLFTSFEIMMWLPDKYDTIASLDKAFLHGKIILKDGKVQGIGIFKDIPLVVQKENDGSYIVTITDFKAVGILPDGKTNENSIIEVMTSSDAGIDEIKIINEALHSEDIAINLFPNPTNDILNFSLLDNNKEENYLINLYDCNGNFIKTIEEKISSSELLTYKLNLANNVTGKNYYYIQIISLSNNYSILRKVLLN